MTTSTEPKLATEQPSPPISPEALRRLSAQAEGEPGGSAGEVLTRVAEFLQLTPPQGKGGTGASLDFLLNVHLPVQADLGHTSLAISEVLKLEAGSVVPLDREVSQPIDLNVGGIIFARGEVVVVEDRFAIRIKELMNPNRKNA